MSQSKATTEEKLAAITRAITCPECGRLMFIRQSGVVCLEPHGRIYRFGELAEQFQLAQFLNEKRQERIDTTNDPLGKQRDASKQVRGMLVSRFPQQVIR